MLEIDFGFGNTFFFIGFIFVELLGVFSDNFCMNAASNRLTLQYIAFILTVSEQALSASAFMLNFFWSLAFLLSQDSVGKSIDYCNANIVLL